MQGLLERLQPLGRALMLPIAVLPVAALLLRLGQPDMFGIAFVADAGGALFANLGLIFAIGVGVGLARENHGAAGLAGAIAYLVTTEGAKALLAVPPAVTADAPEALAATVTAAWKAKELAKLSVPAGILSGLVAGWLYNRYATIKLPEYLAFFGGRRFVPIAAGFAGLGGALLFGLGFPALEGAMDALSRWVVGAGSVGLFLYGALNRLLIVTGLHHILNNLAWFIVGEFGDKTGDLNRFFAGDPSAGAFMSGFFPVMMFGLPAACLAMYRSADPGRRKEVGGLFLSLGLTSLLTGVTEPIEFTFMFLAPVLYLIHAVLTGFAMVLMDALGVKLGFGFSAGLIDYLLNYGLATRPLLLLPVGAAYFAIYYGVFRFAIVRLGLPTPGRERTGAPAPTEIAASNRGAAFVAALGGASNIEAMDACTTRLRLRVADPDAVDADTLKRLGSRGLVRPGGKAVQVVLGPQVEHVADEIRAALNLTSSPLVSPPADEGGDGGVELAPEILAAVGGADNVVAAERMAGRTRIMVHHIGNIDETSLSPLVRGWAVVDKKVLHILD